MRGSAAVRRARGGVRRYPGTLFGSSRLHERKIRRPILNAPRSRRIDYHRSMVPLLKKKPR
ncbi:hypothetical protein PsYK624_046140 [Phanerochaete sordida]|uniref:Uncharacterized protein n=1 Tax=Phanerochaete sordida TaxID=48140 RepID=A0A9P3G5C2_9APHY|nr:hypothetical protein PsYK624_046140 [Phanerochaete sordida]